MGVVRGLGTPEELTVEQGRLVSLGGDRYQLVNDTDYIERLERAVLVSWCSAANPGHCLHCHRYVDTRSRNHDPHAEDCIVPQLVDKYA